MNAVHQLGELRNYIIVGEMMGFLHDVGKLDEALYEGHVERYGEDIKNGLIPELLVNFFSRPIIEIFDEKEVPEWIKRVKIEGFQNHDDRHPFTNLIEKIISIADNQDAKEDRGAHEERSISFDAAFIATPFGYEEKLSDYLSKRSSNDLSFARKELYKKLSELLSEKKITFEVREKLLYFFQYFFSLSLAETRRPSNDVRLIDHAYMVGSIVKSILVACILDEDFRKRIEEVDVSQRIPFKLLVVGFDSYGFVTKANRLPDLAGRSEKLKEVGKKIREIVEFEIPVGNLIYKDLSGMCFLIPDLTSLKGGDEIVEILQRRVISTLINETNGLIVPLVEICGKEDGKASEYIGSLIKNAKEIITKNVYFPYALDSKLIRKLPWVDEWKRRWMWSCDDCKQSGLNDIKLKICPICNSNKLKQKPREKCYVCGYAPEYPIPEGVVSTRGEKLCENCYKLRLEGVAKRWNEKKTMWLDQIRDEKLSSRIALIVGKVWPVEEWVNGNHIEKTTFTVFAHPKEGEKKRKKLNQIKGIFKSKEKTRSHLYEEVRRMVEHNPKALKYFDSKLKDLLISAPSDDEIASFIQELNNILSEKSASPSRLRRVWKELEEFSNKCIEIAEESVETRKQLILSLDRELDTKKNFIGKARIEELDIGTVLGQEKEIVTIDYLDCKIAEEKLDRFTREEIGEIIEGKEIDVEWEDGRKEKLKVESVETNEFKPVVPLYVTAGEFAFLCPANYSLAIVLGIKANFFKRFNKALGKLSLNLGSIYFKYKQPLYLILDAGRRLLKKFESEDLRKRDEEESYRAIRNGNVFIVDELGWNFALNFDDGSEDWYYCTVNSDGKYKPMLEVDGDRVRVCHNFFDYEYLESAQKRFDIALESEQFHPVTKVSSRPYLLEELKKIIALWEIVNPENGKFTNSQIMKLAYLSSDRIGIWDDSLLRDFIKSTIDNIGIKLENDEKRALTDSIIDGSFFDVVELFMKLDQKLGTLLLPLKCTII